MGRRSPDNYEEDGRPYFVPDPLLELLAIKFHEHTCHKDGREVDSWFNLTSEQREVFREMASGDEPLIDSEEGPND